MPRIKKSHLNVQGNEQQRISSAVQLPFPRRVHFLSAPSTVTTLLKQNQTQRQDFMLIQYQNSLQE